MNKQSVYGLAICGGKSIRMGKDKALMDFHGKPQAYHIYEMLEEYCREVYLSCNQQQASTILDGYNVLVDKQAFLHRGPMTAIFTAFDNFGENNFMVIGCDYPLVTTREINNFIKTIQDSTVAAAFYNTEADVYEPLLAYYSAEAGKLLMSAYKNENTSLQRFLKEQNALKYYPEDPACLLSVNTPQEEQTIRQLLEKQRLN